KQKFIVGVGLELKNIKVTSQTFEDAATDFENNRYLNAFGYIKYDSLDNFYFPTAGWFFTGDIQSYIYSSNLKSDFNRFSYVKGDFGFAQSITNKFTFVFGAEGGFALGEETIPFLDFVLGGYG